MPMYEFKCPRGHVNEEMVPYGRVRVRCITRLGVRNCNLWASKTISAPAVIIKDPAVPKRVK